ncbi:TlpA disulfide reductase family protein [Siphonobacter sp. SORGH_AS_1065]|uniref:TlpA disulfide reductase family protein n=1 Tax=Siphonobacter sp. SORGH_AS_1065 TaxID=3041795 RepID=UPI00278270CA|nr:TlpA disulfide reductase family protein [Siphonobacter sp. SORGH_AS_1065]MDQ1087978.1 thiol-disulfide isomerase/thioredoxin [Siphonobacter sp. SORGH_AS_1065]
MKKIFSIGLSLLLSLSAFAQTSVQKGTWRAVVVNKGGELPFGLEIEPAGKANTYTVYVINGKERLKMDPSTLKGDSLHIPMELFDAELIGKVSGKELTGVYKKKRGKQYVTIPFRAQYGKSYRFAPTPQPTTWNVAGKYATTFGEASNAVGVFEQKGSKVAASFLTPTGDYRYLDGDIIGDSLFLSTYDGSHLFLFKAKLEKDKISGDFFSGPTGKSTFVSVKDESASLPDEKSLTFLKPGYEKVTFEFPEAKTGQKLSLDDPRFKGKVVVLQIMGSWCPNCMDETNFMVPWYNKNKKRGVEFVGLSFERSADFKESQPKLIKMIDRFKIPYPVVLAGVPDQSASASLPMLNKIMGYPTTIYIDRKGNVREIHTGFSGPGTGKYYDKFVEDFNLLMDKLIAEK